MTRAESHLVLVGTFNSKNRNTSDEPEKNNNLLLMSLYGSQVDKETLVSSDTTKPFLKCEELSLVAASQLFSPSNSKTIKERKPFINSKSFILKKNVNFINKKKSIAVTALFSSNHINNKSSLRLKNLKSDKILEKYEDVYPNIHADLVHSLIVL